MTNFVLVEFWADIGELFLEFQKRGVIIRPVGGPGPRQLRPRVGGDHAENVRFLAALDELVPARAGA